MNDRFQVSLGLSEAHQDIKSSGIIRIIIICCQTATYNTKSNTNCSKLLRDSELTDSLQSKYLIENHHYIYNALLELPI